MEDKETVEKVEDEKTVEVVVADEETVEERGLDLLLMSLKWVSMSCVYWPTISSRWWLGSKKRIRRGNPFSVISSAFPKVSSLTTGVQWSSAISRSFSELFPSISAPDKTFSAAGF